jgi:DNA-binding NarL/FixJ family response regulator
MPGAPAPAAGPVGDLAQAVVPGSPLNAAYGILGFLLREAVAGAIITHVARPPGGTVVASVGYAAHTAHYLATRMFDEAAVAHLVAEAGNEPVFWADVPRGTSLRLIEDVLIPSGYREGASMVIESDARGRRTMLHVSYPRPEMAELTRPSVASALVPCRQVLADLRARAACRLTPRETQILTLLARGMDNTEIAAALVVARRTVATHVERILAKTGAPSRAGAVAIGIRLGLVPVHPR